MENGLILLELFSGIGGFCVGLQNAGLRFDKVYYSEIDKHAIANYKHNFKDAEYVGSVVDVSGTELRARHPNAKFIITFGWPCQDNSIAGKRKGQVAGTRSFLLNEAVRLIREIQPYCFVAENVKGLYSVNDSKDFRDSLELLSYLDTDDFQYIVEHQLCNTKWVLPQNRERTYFVGYSAKGGWRGVFPITESDFGINERTTETAVASITAGGHSGGHSGGHHSGMTLLYELNSSQDGKVFDTNGITQTLSAGHGNQPKIVAQRGRGEENEQQLEPREDGLTNTLTGVQKDNMIILSANTKQGFETAKEGDSINFSIPSSKTRRGRVGKGVAQTLDSTSNQGVIQINPSLESGGQQPYQQNRVYDSSGVLPALHSLSESTNILNNTNIRRLTEVECERLQGYPDGWTAMGIYDGVVKKVPKTQRYKLCGNAVTTDVVKLVGTRIKMKLL